jgi:plasmid rolling circle replication initiator protein Rep
MTVESGCSPDSTDSFYLSDLSPGDKPWDIHRTAAEQVEHLYSQTEFTRYAERINQCSRLLEYAFKANDLGEVALKLQSSKFCRVPQCPVCQWRRSMKWRARFFKAMPKILEDYPTARFVFLTLTVKNCELTELRPTISKMNLAWKLLTKRKEFPAIGFVRTLEITKSENGTAHPHFHCILMVKSSYFTHGYISQAKWTELWKSCLRIEYTPVVNVKSIKPPKDTIKYENSALDNAIIASLCETLKYSVKESDLVTDSKWLEELTRQLLKTRKISLGGVFKQYLSEDEPEDLIHTDLSTDEEPIADDDPRVRFSWETMAKRYKK